jgi:hypothetical protein
VEENCKEVLEILDNINEILSGEKDPPDLNISYYVYEHGLMKFVTIYHSLSLCNLSPSLSSY